MEATNTFDCGLRPDANPALWRWRFRRRAMPWTTTPEAPARVRRVDPSRNVSALHAAQSACESRVTPTRQGTFRPRSAMHTDSQVMNSKVSVMDAGTIRAWLQSPVTFDADSPGSHAGLMLDEKAPQTRRRWEESCAAGEFMRREPFSRSGQIDPGEDVAREPRRLLLVQLPAPSNDLHAVFRWRFGKGIVAMCPHCWRR